MLIARVSDYFVPSPLPSIRLFTGFLNALEMPQLGAVDTPAQHAQ
jgi:hypothetical protein